MVIVSNKAAGEILKATIWYDKQSVGLGNRFIEKLEYYFNRIQKYPDMYKKAD